MHISIVVILILKSKLPFDLHPDSDFQSCHAIHTLTKVSHNYVSVQAMFDMRQHVSSQPMLSCTNFKLSYTNLEIDHQ